MLKSLIAVAVTCAVATPVLASQDQWEGQVNRYLDAAGQAIASQFSPTGYQKSGSLGQGDSERVSVSVGGSGNYAIVGVCDNDCTDLDIEIRGSDGGVLGSDYAVDDTPVVRFGSAGSATVTVEVSMAACSSEPCRYGFRVYRQR